MQSDITLHLKLLRGTYRLTTIGSRCNTIALRNAKNSINESAVEILQEQARTWRSKFNDTSAASRGI